MKTVKDKPEQSMVAYWLALKFVPRLAVSKKLELVKMFGLVELFSLPLAKLTRYVSQKQATALMQPDWQRIERIIQQTALSNSQVIGFDHPCYPPLLKQIFDPPLVLFVKGNIENLLKEQVAIVGSRNATIYGRETAFEFAQLLAEHNAVVTSGLALGIDAAAHQGVVAVELPTIAVIATGIDKVYPSRHKPLVTKILAAGGTIITEFLPETPPKAGHFPKRNRIISGMSSGVIVIEAAMKSGSLITAKSALEQNREVFAVPGNINNPLVLGCHWLIKQGAKLIDNFDDIKEELNFLRKISLNSSRNKEKVKESKKSCDQGLSNDPLLASVDYEITPVDIVVSRSKLPTDVVLTRLTMLELRGLVSAVPGGYLKLNRG